MEKLYLVDFENIIKSTIETIIKNEKYFNELDSKAGDGDLGASLSRGFKKIKENWKGLSNYDDIGVFMRECGLIITEHCGGSSGPIWGTAFIYGGKYSKGKKDINLKEFLELAQAMAEGMQKIGKAEKGDKTLLDSILPAIESLEGSVSNNKDFILAIKKCIKAAYRGAEDTKNMIAKKGRASYVGERSLGFPDAGAMAIAIILKDIFENIFLKRNLIK